MVLICISENLTASHLGALIVAANYIKSSSSDSCVNNTEIIFVSESHYKLVMQIICEVIF